MPNERPLTGLLAAAAWSLPNGWSLEEFCAKRRRDEYSTARPGEPKRRKFWGRADLWVGCGPAKATIEAKLYWGNQTPDVAKKKVRELLDEAGDQLRSLKDTYQVGDLVSVCFVVPWYAGADSKARGRDLLTEFEEWARSSKKMATAKHISKKDTCWKGREYPGVLLIAKREDRAM